MESGEWKVESGEWKVESGKWEVESGKWRVESGEWEVESGKWRVESGEWRVESGQSAGSSITLGAYPCGLHCDWGSQIPPAEYMANENRIIWQMKKKLGATPKSR